MRVSDITALLPECGRLLAEYGLHCFGCEASATETLEQGCASHGFSDDEIATLVADLNTLLDERPPRPQTLTVTLDAARALAQTLAEQEKNGWVLRVVVDETGFCMELAERADQGELSFGHRAVPDLRVVASPPTLDRLGGSTIDFREGRFKLDLADDLVAPSCACNGRCTCADRSAQH